MRGAPRPSARPAFLRLPPLERLDVAARRLRLLRKLFVSSRVGGIYFQVRHQLCSEVVHHGSICPSEVPVLSKE